MTEKESFKSVLNSAEDVLQIFLKTVSSARVDYCVIGGLAVNAYTEPVVSPDLDVVVTAEDSERLCEAIESRFQVERFGHRVNLSSGKSSLRIQLQSDPALPICPLCGSPMVLRTARNGPWTGSQFWGCPKYPRCKETLRV